MLSTSQPSPPHAATATSSISTATSTRVEYMAEMQIPTVDAADRIRTATLLRQRLVLQGVTMGGGPSHWATLDHVRAGLAAFATPDAACTFDDDLDAVAEMGIQVVSDDEALQ